MTAYDVKYTEVQDLMAEYLDYQSSLSEASKNLNDRVLGVVGLSSFEGRAGQGIKSYFNETHQVFLSAFDTLARQLATEYATEYYDKFNESPISEDDNDARWVRSAMSSAMRALKSVQEGDIQSAEANLERAMRLIPADCSFSFPSASDLNVAIDDERENIKRTRDAVEDAEGNASSVFTSSSGDFGTLASSLMVAVVSCNTPKTSMYSYTPGTFKKIAQESGLIEAYKECAGYQAENQQTLIDSQEDCLNRKEMRIQEAEREAAKEKAFWMAIGTIAAAVVVVGAAIGTVASFGAGAPALVVALNVTAGVIGTASAAGDMADRVDQINRFCEGDWGADKGEGDDALDTALSGVKQTLKSGAKDIHGDEKIRSGKNQFWEGVAEKNETKASDGWNLKEDGKALKDEALSSAKDYVIDEAADALIDQIQDDDVRDAAKFGKEAGTGLYDAVKTYVSQGKLELNDAGGVVSTVGKCGTIVADHFTEEADQKIADCEKRKQEVNELRQDLKENASTDWHVI